MKVDKCILINLTEEELRSVCNTTGHMQELLNIIEKEPDYEARFELTRGDEDIQDLLKVCCKLAEYF